VVGIAPTKAGEGYWMVASDGGVFSYGAAKFAGSTGSMNLVAPIVGMAAVAVTGATMTALIGWIEKRAMPWRRLA